SVTLTALVLPTSPGPNPVTGSVAFKDGGTTIATITLINSQASLTTTRLSAGTHAISAVYNGGNCAASGSLVRAITVARRATVTALAASPTTITKGQAVTLTASVRATTAGAATPTGTVTFKDGSKVVGTGALSGGVARLTLNTLAVGTHTLTAVYSGAGADL